MGFQCAPQVIGLVRGEPKPGQKHRANGGKILREMGEERHSKTNHLDRTLSQENVYEGYTSGQECWDDLCSVAEEGVAVMRKNKETGETEPYTRKVRKDAVIGWAVIIHPADEVTANWTWEEFEEFDEAAMEVLAEIEPRLFRPSNERISVEHHDEAGNHTHHAGESKDETGKYCGNLVDGRLMDRINKSFPRMMRERGYDVDDMDVTDWERAKTDLVYRDERNQRRRSQHKDTNDYAADAAERRAEQAKEAEAEALSGLAASLAATNDAEVARDEAEEGAAKAKREQAIAETKRDMAVLFSEELARKQATQASYREELLRELIAREGERHALMVEENALAETDLVAQSVIRRAEEDAKATRDDADRYAKEQRTLSDGALMDALAWRDALEKEASEMNEHNLDERAGVSVFIGKFLRWCESKARNTPFALIVKRFCNVVREGAWLDEYTNWLDTGLVNDYHRWRHVANPASYGVEGDAVRDLSPFKLSPTQRDDDSYEVSM